MSWAQIAERNVIAVYPKTEWYRTRVRYTLIVTIETPNVEIDIYTPVLNQVENVIEVHS